MEGSLRHYEQSLAVDPNNPNTHHNLGVLYETRIGDDGHALEHYRVAAELYSIRGDEARAAQVREYGERVAARMGM